MTIESNNMISKDVLKGSLVRLAPFKADDAEQMSRWTEDYDYLRRMDTDWAVPDTVDQFREKDRRGSRGKNSVEFRLRTIEDDQLIGFVALHSVEWNNQACLMAIGIGHPDYRSKGYGTDALQLILQYAFLELNLNRVGLDVIEYNERAVRAYEKVGFKREGSMRAAVLRDNRSYDRLILGILRSEWLELHNM